MTDREIDALVAEKVMEFSHECQLIGAGVESDPMRLEPPNAVYRRRSPKDRYWQSWSPDGAEVVIQDSVPHYSMDTAAAWRVVEELQKKECRVVIAYFPDREANALGAGLPGKVNVRLMSLSVRHPLNSSAWADSAPMAICLAALTWVLGAEVPA